MQAVVDRLATIKGD